MLEVTIEVWRIMYSVLKKKKKGCSGKGFAEKRGFKCGMREWVMKN